MIELAYLNMLSKALIIISIINKQPSWCSAMTILLNELHEKIENIVLIPDWCLLTHLIIVLTHSKHKHYYCGVVFNWFIIAAVGTIGVVEQVLVCSCLALVIIHSIKNVMLNQTWQGFLEAQFMGSSDVC